MVICLLLLSSNPSRAAPLSRPRLDAKEAEIHSPYFLEPHGQTLTDIHTAQISTGDTVLTWVSISYVWGKALFMPGIIHLHSDPKKQVLLLPPFTEGETESSAN